MDDLPGQKEKAADKASQIKNLRRPDKASMVRKTGKSRPDKESLIMQTGKRRLDKAGRIKMVYPFLLFKL